VSPRAIVLLTFWKLKKQLKNRNWLREQDLNLRPFADNKSEPEGDCVFDVTEESAGCGSRI
jgi:hypothetical protein